MKKFVALSLALTMALSLAACGGDTTSSGGDTSGTGESSSSDGVTLRLVNGKIEVDEQLKKLAELYKEETGVTVEIQSMGGGIDIQSELKNYYQADNMPDIFVNGSEADFANWEGLLVDMSDQPWVSDTDQAYTDDSGAVLGFPYTTEAIGMAPFAFSEEPIETILTASPSWWSIYSGSEHIEEAKAFLNWCAGDTAQQVLVEEGGFISPFASCTYVASDPFAQTIADYTASGKTSAWDWMSMIEGVAQNCTGVLYQQFAMGNLTVDQFVESMQTQLAAYYAENA